MDLDIEMPDGHPQSALNYASAWSELRVEHRRRRQPSSAQSSPAAGNDEQGSPTSQGSAAASSTPQSEEWDTVQIYSGMDGVKQAAREVDGSAVGVAQQRERCRSLKYAMQFQRTKENSIYPSFYAAAVYHINTQEAHTAGENTTSRAVCIASLIEGVSAALQGVRNEFTLSPELHNDFVRKNGGDIAGPTTQSQVLLTTAGLAVYTRASGAPATWSVTVHMDAESWKFLFATIPVDTSPTEGPSPGALYIRSCEKVDWCGDKILAADSIERRTEYLLKAIAGNDNDAEEYNLISRLLVDVVGAIPAGIEKAVAGQSNGKASDGSCTVYGANNWDGRTFAVVRIRNKYAIWGKRPAGEMKQLTHLLSHPQASALVLWDDKFAIANHSDGGLTKAASKGQKKITDTFNDTPKVGGLTLVSEASGFKDYNALIESIRDIMPAFPRMNVYGARTVLKDDIPFDVNAFVRTFADVITQSSEYLRENADKEFEKLERSSQQRSAKWTEAFLSQINHFIDANYEEAEAAEKDAQVKVVKGIKENYVDKAKLKLGERNSLRDLYDSVKRASAGETPSKIDIIRLEAYERFCQQSATLAAINAFFLRTCVSFNLLQKEDILLDQVIGQQHKDEQKTLDTIRKNIGERLKTVFAGEESKTPGSSPSVQSFAWLTEDSAYASRFLPPINLLRTLWQAMDGFDVEVLQNRLAAGMCDAETDIISAVFQTLLDPSIDDLGRTARNVRTFGKVYTPRPLVHFVLRACGIDSSAEGPSNDVLADDIEHRLSQSDPTKYLTAVRSVLDPASGSGGFIATYAGIVVSKLRRCEAVWEDHDRLERAFEAIVDNVWGVEIDFVAWEISIINVLVQVLPVVRQLQVLREKRSTPGKKATPVIIPRFNILRENTLSLFSLEMKVDKKNTLRKEPKEQLRDYRKFDFVLGNPPYSTRKYSKAAFECIDDEYYKKKEERKSPWSVLADRSASLRHQNWNKQKGKAQLHLFFFLFGARHVKRGGKLGFIGPAAFVASESDLGFKQWLLTFVVPETIYYAPRYVFFEAQTDTIVMVCRPREDTNRPPMSAMFSVVRSPGSGIKDNAAYMQTNIKAVLKLWDEFRATRDDFLATAQRCGTKALITARYELSVIPASALIDSADPKPKESERDVMGDFRSPGWYDGSGDLPETRKMHQVEDGVELGKVATVGRGQSIGADHFFLFESAEKFAVDFRKVLTAMKDGKKMGDAATLAIYEGMPNTESSAKKLYTEFLTCTRAEQRLKPCHFDKDLRNHYAAVKDPGDILQCYSGELAAPQVGSVTRLYLEYIAIGLKDPRGLIKASKTKEGTVALAVARMMFAIKEVKGSSHAGAGKACTAKDGGKDYLTMTNQRNGFGFDRPYLLQAYFGYRRRDSRHRCIQFALVEDACIAKDNFVFVSVNEDSPWTNLTLLGVLNSFPVEVFICRKLAKWKQADTFAIKNTRLPKLPLPPLKALEMENIEGITKLLVDMYVRLRTPAAKAKATKRKDLVMLRSAGALFCTEIASSGGLAGASSSLTFYEFLLGIDENTAVSDLIESVKAAEECLVKDKSADETAAGGDMSKPLAAFLGNRLTVREDVASEGDMTDRAEWLLSCFDEADLNSVVQAVAILDIASRLQALLDALVFAAYGFQSKEVANTWRLLGYTPPQTVRVHISRARAQVGATLKDQALDDVERMADHLSEAAQDYCKTGLFLGLSIGRNKNGFRSAEDLLSQAARIPTPQTATPAKPSPTAPRKEALSVRGTSSRKRKAAQARDAAARQQRRRLMTTVEKDDSMVVDEPSDIDKDNMSD